MRGLCRAFANDRELISDEKIDLAILEICKI